MPPHRATTRQHANRGETDNNAMIPDFNSNGYLPPGIHDATWQEVYDRFATNPHRARLTEGLLLALRCLKTAGCQTVYLDGNFVTDKERPNDYDAAWTTAGVDPEKLHAALLRFDRNGRTHQKRLFMGELFVADYPADEQGRTFLEFFQTDRRRRRKGVVSVQLRTLP